MAIKFHQAAIVGATGSTGKHLARELIAREIPVRVISRNESHLLCAFGDTPVERVAADALEANAIAQALEGCDIVFDCIGLPMARIADHPRTARNLAAAIARTSTRAVQVSSYWAYLPLQQTPLSEAHPRTGGNLPMRMRREAEDILHEAAAAVVHLPDFYGPEVHASTLQHALIEAVSGKTIHWVGSPETPREYVYVPDAMKVVAELAGQEAAYGEHWLVPGAGPIPLSRVVAIVARHLGRPVKVRGTGP
jgi:nucleoside-diphosphate-sugar epimerase